MYCSVQGCWKLKYAKTSLFPRSPLAFLWAPFLSGDFLAWCFCGLGQRFPALIFIFLMNYKVVGGPLGLADW